MTINEAIQARAQQYIELFERLRANPIEGVNPNIATHDLWRAVYVNEEALRIVEAHIAKVESEVK